MVVPTDPIAFTSEFIQRDDKKVQWKAFIRRSSPEGLPGQFEQVVDGIAAFPAADLSYLVASQPMPRRWEASGPWRV